MFQPPPQRYEDLTYTQKADLFNRLLGLPALTLIAWGRRDVGYRCLTGAGPALMFLLSLGIAAFCPPRYQPGWLAGYALFSAVAGACQRFKRWRELKRGVVQHSLLHRHLAVEPSLAAGIHPKGTASGTLP